MAAVHLFGVPNRNLAALLHLAYFVLSFQTCGSLLIDPTLIGQELQTFAKDALGVDEMQKYFDDLQYHKRVLKGSNVIPLALKLSDKFKTRFKIAERLKKAVEDAYGPKEEPFVECCKFDKASLEYDVRFRVKVDLNSMCMKISGTSPKSPMHLDKEIFKEIKAISEEYPSVKYIYFASEEGVMTIFPAYDDPVPCDSYDPRFRPFYVDNATPEAKDVVLVIDTSWSMVGDKLDVAKQAAKTVLDTLNPKDQVGIVSFVDDVKTPNGENCYKEQLALAIPTNIRNMKKFVDSQQAYAGHTKFTPAFKKAFELLKGSVSEDVGKTRKRVILLLTDGAPSDSKEIKDLFVTIRDSNVELNNSVLILTYGFDKNHKDILIDIANQNGTKYGVPANTSVGDVAHGSYTYIEDIRTLRTEMATYYDLFADQSSHPEVSVPYVDGWGSGLLVSITMSCYHHGKFIGLAGTDINIEDLMPDITEYFKQGRTTYAFMISRSGRTLIHPLLPAPADAYGDPIYMDIRNLERPESKFKEIFESMAKGMNGNKSFAATRYLPRGGSIVDGVTETYIDSNYYWYPVVDTEFSVGVVIPSSLKNDVLNPLDIPHGFTFTYHRIDLSPPEKACSYFGKMATKDTTVVKFTADAFSDPYEYVGSSETNISVLLLSNYIMNRPGSETYSKLRSGIRDTVIATWKLEDVWLHDKKNLTEYLVWRYIGTADGVFRETPGDAMAKSYDHRKRPWYHVALRHSGLLTLTTPYLDSGGAGEVITAARALFHGESSHVHRAYDEALGVMGADFPLRYFYRLLTEVYPKCKDIKDYSCFVIDDAGFLVMHEDFMDPSASKQGGVEHVHITEKEKHIAEHMTSNGYLVKKECRKLEDIQEQTFYEVRLPPGGVNALDNAGRCKQYQLGKIEGTNVYLGIAVRASICSTVGDCTCSSDKQCLNTFSSCECPCTSKLDFRYCLGQFPNSSLPICPALSPEHSDSAPVSPSKDCLEECFDPQCGEKNDQKTCDGIVSCYWCKRDKHNVILPKPYCGSSDKCFRGKETLDNEGDNQRNKLTCNPTTHTPSSPGSTEASGLSAASVAGISIACIIVVVLILIGIYLGIKYYRNTRGPPVRQGRTPSTQKIVPPESPDHPESSGNQGHDYENPEEMQMWPAPYNEIQRRLSYPVHLPTIPEPTEEAIPIENTGRRPSQQAPPVPLTRRPSGAIEVPGMFQPGGLPSTMGKKRKPSGDSSGVNNIQVSQEHTPPLLPRTRSPSKISFDSTHDPELPFPTSPPQRIEKKETHYGNVASVANKAFESHGEEDEDVLDSHGYENCAHARNAPEEPHKTYVNN